MNDIQRMLTGLLIEPRDTRMYNQFKEKYPSDYKRQASLMLLYDQELDRDVRNLLYTRIANILTRFEIPLCDWYNELRIITEAVLILSPRGLNGMTDNEASMFLLRIMEMLTPYFMDATPRCEYLETMVMFTRWDVAMRKWLGPNRKHIKRNVATWKI